LKGELPTKMLSIVWLIPLFEKRDIGADDRETAQRATQGGTLRGDDKP